MMILRSSPPSPFGRKVEIAASIVGLAKEIDVVAADTGDPNEILRRQNPLGKIPVLVLEDGTAIFDSRVIVEYLDMRAGGDVLIPAEPKTRVKALTAAALADGILDAALLQIYEQRFRAPDGAWRSEYPSLVAWLDAFAADVPAFEATRVKA
jgi:glutathione S-transferase